MIEFGETLRKTREAKGLSVSEVAQKTHMLVQQVEALEKEDFSKIAAPIYGRGFVRLYCEAVGISDPKPLVDEFMDIYSGNRAPTIRIRRSIVPSPPAEQTPTAAQPPSPTDHTLATATEPPEIDNLFSVLETAGDASVSGDSPTGDNPGSEHATDGCEDDFSDAITTSESIPEKNEEEELRPASDNLFDFALKSDSAPRKTITPTASSSDNADPASATQNPSMSTDAGTSSSFSRPHGPSRYAAPQPIEYDKPERFKIPPAAFRIGILAAGAFFVLWLLIKGVSTVYNAAMSSEKPEPSTGNTSYETVQTPPSVPSTDDKVAPLKAQERKPMKLRPLFID